MNEKDIFRKEWLQNNFTGLSFVAAVVTAGANAFEVNWWILAAVLVSVLVAYKLLRK